MENITLTIDGKSVSVPPGTSVLEAAKTIGFEVPHYCYHPGLSVAGNCRMCLVKIDKMPKPAISCKTPVAPDMVVHTQTEEVKKMQQNIMEFLLINHPLDCPTCDQAGECRLQDYYMQYDLIPSRFKEEKVHKDKMVDLGAGVMLDEERCIVCTRCVRFCQEVAKDEELYVQSRGDHSMVATFPGREMKNPYAGNTIDVCPVGALTSKDFRYKKRVWFLQKTPSICTGCSRGCNITVEQADNTVYRFKPRFNEQINKWWMCDEGRYSYKTINEGRHLKASYNQAGELIAASLADTLAHLENHLKTITSPLVFVTSAQESVEEIDAFVDLANTVGGVVCFSKNDPDNPTSDNILIQADKNPNLKHIEALKLQPLAAVISQGAKLIIQNGVSHKDLELLKKHNAEVLCLLTSNRSDLDALAECILPTPTFAEQSGHFVNFEGYKQKFEMAFKPRGEAMTLKHYTAWLLPLLAKQRSCA